jgi:hypothetical protein
MGKYQFRVLVKSPTTGTFNVLPDLQNMTITHGRRQITDPFRAGTAQLSGLDPADLPEIVIGAQMRIERKVSSVSWAVYWVGYVADLKTSYGFVANQDRWELSCEDSLAVVGKMFTRTGYSWAAGLTTEEAAADVGNDALFNLEVGFMTFSLSTVSAQSVPNENALDLLNRLATTEQARIAPAHPSNSIPLFPRVIWYGRDRGSIAAANTVFTDDTLTSALSKIYYNRVEFASQADSYFNRIVVEPAGLTPQVEGTGDRSYTASTYDQTTTQADNLASYLLGALDVDNAVPSVIGCTAETQVNDSAIDFAQYAFAGLRVEIILRGVKYTAFVEGAVVSSDPNQTFMTFYLSSAQAQVGFVLDDASLGVLDTSKLGF